MQSTARKNELPLDKMCLVCEVTKKLTREEITSPPRDGANVHGLYMEVRLSELVELSCQHTLQGARWDLQQGTIAESRLKELYPAMPVIFIKAITQDKQELRNLYECPVYTTRERGERKIIVLILTP